MKGIQKPGGDIFSLAVMVRHMKKESTPSRGFKIWCAPFRRLVSVQNPSFLSWWDCLKCQADLYKMSGPVFPCTSVLLQGLCQCRPPVAPWYGHAPSIGWGGDAACSSPKAGFVCYAWSWTISYSRNRPAVLWPEQTLNPFLSNISYQRRSKLLCGHLINDQSDGVEGHCLSPGQIDAEAVAKRG